MAGDEDQLAVRRALRGPFQIVLALDRLAVLVHAEERHVEVVARIREVVGIAAEERDLLLGREDQPDVGVFLVAIQPVLAALVERHDVGPQAGLVEAFFLDARDLGLPRVERLLLAVAPGLAPRSARASVTFSIDISTFSSRSGHFNSSARARARRSRRRRSSSAASKPSAAGRARRDGWSARGRVGLTNDPDPPSLKRTLDSRRWSSHAVVGLKPYFSRAAPAADCRTSTCLRRERSRDRPPDRAGRQARVQQRGECGSWSYVNSTPLVVNADARRKTEATEDPWALENTAEQVSLPKPFCVFRVLRFPPRPPCVGFPTVTWPGAERTPAE